MLLSLISRQAQKKNQNECSRECELDEELEVAENTGGDAVPNRKACKGKCQCSMESLSGWIIGEGNKKGHTDRGLWVTEKELAIK